MSICGTRCSLARKRGHIAVKSGMRSVAGSLVLLAATASALLAAPAPGSVDADFFETKIRPLFAEKCYACHTEARMGGLQLDSREHFLKGGKSGPIAVPGDPDASLLVKALRYDANPKMPPTGKLPADQIAAVEAWVKAGAVWPQDEKSALKSRLQNHRGAARLLVIPTRQAGASAGREGPIGRARRLTASSRQSLKRVGCARSAPPIGAR